MKHRIVLLDELVRQRGFGPVASMVRRIDKWRRAVPLHATVTVSF